MRVFCSICGDQVTKNHYEAAYQRISKNKKKTLGLRMWVAEHINCSDCFQAISRSRAGTASQHFKDKEEASKHLTSDCKVLTNKLKMYDTK